MTPREDFLRDYEALVRKHRMLIVACGCCDSPQLDPLRSEFWDSAAGKRIADPDGAQQIKAAIEHLR